MTHDIVTEIAELLRVGRLDDVYARSEKMTSPMIGILRARALIAQGYAAGPKREGGTAESILKKLEADPDGDVALLAQVELVHAHYVGAMMGDSTAPGIHEAVALGKRAGQRPGVQTPVLFLAGYLAGQLAIRARRFDIAREELRKIEALARSKDDGGMLALTEAALGRLSAWQGRIDVAEIELRRAIDYWEAQGNRLQAAHTRYELGVLQTDRRDWNQAIEELKTVVAVYEANAVHRNYLGRARQALCNALIGARQLTEAGAILETLRDIKDPYRAAILHRDLARLNLGLAESASGLAANAFVEKGRQEWKEARELVKDASPDDFMVLSLRLVEGQLIAVDPAIMGAESPAVGADVLARVAELFAAPSQTSKKLGDSEGLVQVERHHEIAARIAAIKAYVAAGKATPGAAKSLFASALTEVTRLHEAAAAVALSLDGETLALVAEAEELAGKTPAPAAADEPASNAEGSEESLLNFMRRDTPEAERLAVLARLATDLERLYGMGIKPCGFGPGDVVIRASGIPVIASFDGPEAALRPERAAERVFVAPEVLKPDASPDFRADLYVIGALLITWFGGDPPANKGFWLSLTRAWKRPLKKRGGLLADLALELTALDPKNRPESASIAADRLHQAALALSSSQAAA